MKEEIMLCRECKLPMIEIGETGKNIQTGEMGEDGLWKQTGIRSEILYQCPEDKTITIN